MEENVKVVGEYDVPEDALWYPRGIINLNPWKTLYAVDTKTLHVREIGRMKKAGAYRIDVRDNVEDFKDAWRRSRKLETDSNVENVKYPAVPEINHSGDILDEIL